MEELSARRVLAHQPGPTATGLTTALRALNEGLEQGRGHEH
jgi:hypothetical protein